jgi:hypothetical protein
MESAGQTPRTYVEPSELAPLYEKPGPVATVLLTTEAEVENAAQRSEVRWKTLRRAMADAGVPDDVLAAVDPWVPDAHLEGEQLAVIAGGDGARVVEHFPDPPVLGDRFRWGPLPWAGPFAEARQSAVPHVVVSIDRTGAEIVLIRGGRLEADERVEGGRDYPLQKSKPGGWSQRRYQQRAENTWQENASNVADELTDVVHRSGARLVVVSGDVRAVQLLRDALPEDVGALVEVVDGDVAAETVRLVNTVVASDTVALLQKFKEEKGQADRAADGIAATITALNQSQVEVLLVHDDPDDTRTAWCGADPTPIAASPTDLKDLGVDSPDEAPLVDVLIRAAVGTGAGVRMTPGAPVPNDGVGAILRWAT